MNPRDQSRRRRFQPSGGRGYVLLMGAVFMVQTGCESGFGARRQGDPFLGPASAPTPVATPNTPAKPSTQTASVDQTPPLPASYSAVGPASVAGGETATSEPGRPLRIGSDPVTPASSAVRGVAPGITVGNPEPAANGSTSHLTPMPASGVSASPAGAPATVGAPSASAASIHTFEDAQRYLEQHGVTRQRLDKVDNGWWKFECSVPNPTNPHVNKTYETSKPFPDPLSAIRAIISKIEETPH